MADRLSQKFNEPILNEVAYPEPDPMLYVSKTFPRRWYQIKGVNLLLEKRHAALEFATGSGKSFLICVAKSLMNINPYSEDFKNFKDKKVLCTDESHGVPAESLAKIALKLFGHIPYRFFLSGTQMRNDGLDLVLEGITGPVLMNIPVMQLVREGFLANPKFFQFLITSDSKLEVSDAIKMNRQHLHKNDKIYQHAAGLIEAALKQGKRPLVLVEEVPQFVYLLKYLTSKAGFAHGGVDVKMKKILPEEYWKSDPMKLVEQFDDGTLPVLVGTSCISMGTDIKTPNFVIDLVGLASEIRLRQSVGRATRLAPGKTDFIYCDYAVMNKPVLMRHADKRRKIFESIAEAPVKIIEVK